MTEASHAIVTAPDPLLTFIETLHNEGGLFARFTGGVSIAFRAARFLLHHRELWRAVAIPAILNLTLFGLTVTYALFRSVDLTNWIWAEPAGWWVALWWVLRAFVTVTLLIVSYYVVMIVGGVIASPFNDHLSERTEDLLRGHVVRPEEEGLRSTAESMVRSAYFSVAISVVYGISALIVLSLNLVPFVGPVLSAVLGPVVSAFFLCLEYCDYPLERRRYSLSDKLGLVTKHREICLGFGAGTFVLLLIPMLNFLCMPLAVIGGTALGLSLDHQRDHPSSIPSPPLPTEDSPDP